VVNDAVVMTLMLMCRVSFVCLVPDVKCAYTQCVRFHSKHAIVCISTECVLCSNCRLHCIANVTSAAVVNV